ncbi:conserved hypothetical protein [Uncinocarpus reesii 1704]|uniref:VWFA domain-containing protein n=1 Tax=Uncinocarpus reesii (strain UAMH 1704) TaxID=336963 RepID=C4JI95_UNCRE|nr:uncharacterized protein UREG_02841 [Uncinocarpus reesii 1704]EEP77992.1 conserved hypothetical protein [Uncinocarpus reesii 1704]
MGLFSSSRSKQQATLRPDSIISRGFGRRSRSRSQGEVVDRSFQPHSVPTTNFAPSYPLEAPPAYTAQAPSNTSTNASCSDSPYAFLTQFDTVFLIDDSGSMAGRSWRETEAALSAIAPICTQFDADGVDIYFLNHINRQPSQNTGAYRSITSPVEVHEVFTSVSPRGGTPTGKRLGQILKPYLDQLESLIENDRFASSDSLLRPLNLIVITDGVPTDDVESVIVSAARKLDRLNAQPWQIGIQFFQVGNEPDAAEDLRELDDSLAGQQGVRDMVDTVPWNANNGGAITAEGILKVVLGAVHRKYDRRNAAGRRE